MQKLIATYNIKTVHPYQLIPNPINTARWMAQKTVYIKNSQKKA